MNVTKVFVDQSNDDAIVATASLYLDDEFAVHDLRVMRDGRIFMPSRPKSKRCATCRKRCNATARYCEWCGDKAPMWNGSQPYVDVAHPLTPEVRSTIEEAVRKAHGDMLLLHVPERDIGRS